jgi:hypothetical protein
MSKDFAASGAKVALVDLDEAGATKAAAQKFLVQKLTN